MKKQKQLRGFSVKRAPAAESAKLIELLRAGRYREAQELVAKQDARAEQAAKRYVASLLQVPAIVK